MTTSPPEAAEWVPCDYCQDPIERHTMAGCDRCPCFVRWKIREIKAERVRLGLPEQYNRWSL